MMRVVEDYPPLWDEINARFHLDGWRPILAWGDIIYNPTGIVVTPSLMAHEAVHGRRQAGDIEGWWRRYMEDAAFRLAEEIPAHRAEYQVALAGAANRNARRATEKLVAKRLSGALYGRMITLPAARRLIRQGEK